MKNHTQAQGQMLILSVSVKTMSFGSKLKQWRKAKGMTQEELALAVGVNVSYISNLERDFSATTKSGKPKASEGLTDRFAKVLGVDNDEMRLAAGHAPKNNSEVLELAYRLADSVMASGYNELDEQSQEDFLADMQTIAESMLKRRTQEQEKKRRKTRQQNKDEAE